METQRSDRILTVLALALLGIGCFLVLRPFLSATLWAAILASTSWPGLLWLDRAFGGRRTLSASVMTMMVTLVVLGPVVAATAGLADDVAELGRAASTLLEQGLPDPPDWVVELPLVGQSVHDYWQQFAHDGQRLVEELAKLAEPARATALAAGKALGEGVIDLGLSVFLAFFFYLHGEALAGRLRVALERLAGARARYLTGVARGTVSGVIFGILGTALAQAILAAIGFAIAGVPGAVVLGGATFFLSLIPVGPPLVWGGAAVWLFQQGQTGWAVFVAAWGFLLVSTVDNLIKPFIISRGARLPFAIVFLGVLGGVLAFGVIGAFLGPTLLALGYRLVAEWTGSEDPGTP